MNATMARLHQERMLSQLALVFVIVVSGLVAISGVAYALMVMLMNSGLLGLGR